MKRKDLVFSETALFKTFTLIGGISTKVFT